METQRASALIRDNLPALYGYSFARLYDKEDAYDLTSEIVCEILTAAETLQKEAAFWGFVWKIAENTFRKFIRRKTFLDHIRDMPETDQNCILWDSPETTLLEQETEHEELYLLRREPALLVKTHREVTVAYYIRGKSCSEIAEEQKISVQMVKYYLFKTRKLLKEGIGMTRKLGEKSYNPGVFRMDFWGDNSTHYTPLFDRKLPGSILLAAYDAPMTMAELSTELGVSTVYLEDEIEILEAAGVIRESGDRYQTSIVIITDAYEKEFMRSTADVYDKIADKIFADTAERLADIRALNFSGSQCDDNRLLWTVLNIAMLCGWTEANRQSPLGKVPRLALGGNGWVFGYDNDYENHHFNGVSMHTEIQGKGAWFSAENYRVIERCQLYDHSNFIAKAEAMCDAVLGNPADEKNAALPDLIEGGFLSCQDGILAANFPVFAESAFNGLCELLRPISQAVADCMIEISDRAEKILMEHAPESVRTQCGDIAKIHHRLDVMAFLLESMVKRGMLTVPNEKVNLCIFGVKKNL